MVSWLRYGHLRLGHDIFENLLSVPHVHRAVFSRSCEEVLLISADTDWIHWVAMFVQSRDKSPFRPNDLLVLLLMHPEFSFMIYVNPQTLMSLWLFKMGQKRRLRSLLGQLEVISNDEPFDYPSYIRTWRMHVLHTIRVGRAGHKIQRLQNSVHFTHHALCLLVIWDIFVRILFALFIFISRNDRHI